MADASDETWRGNALAIGCECATAVKPCPYHEGWRDALDLMDERASGDEPPANLVRVDERPDDPGPVLVHVAIYRHGAEIVMAPDVDPLTVASGLRKLGADIANRQRGRSN